MRFIWEYRWSHGGIGLYVVLKLSHNVKIITEDCTYFRQSVEKIEARIASFHKLNLYLAQQGNG